MSPNGDGTLGNLLKFRDETCVQYQNQLDLIAANLVGLFNGKKDKNVKGLDLFQVDSVTGPGMAGTIHVNPKYITGAKGGDSTLLGDSKNLNKDSIQHSKYLYLIAANKSSIILPTAEINLAEAP